MNPIQIGTAFLEGLGMILSPCILPILPIMLAGSTCGGKRRPLGIIVGFVVVFTLVTLLLRSLVQQTGISADLLRHIAFVILLCFGITMVVPPLSRAFARVTARFANIGSRHTASAQTNQNGFGSGLLLGATVSLVWTPCAGPLLAAVIIQTITSQTNLTSYGIVFAFGLGSAIPMLIIALFGRQAMHKIHGLKIHGERIKQVFGVIIIASALLLASGLATQLYAAPAPVRAFVTPGLIDPETKPYPAPELTGIDAWINSKPLKLNQLKQQVILLEFWSYTCIHCLRTVPIMNELYHTYHKKGLIIIGIHSPQYPFQKSIPNVKAAVKRLKIAFPVAVDNEFKTFLNYNNSVWPSLYLIDSSGRIVYHHIGEVDRPALETNINQLLARRPARKTTDVRRPPSSQPHPKNTSPIKQKEPPHPHH